MNYISLFFLLFVGFALNAQSGCTISDSLFVDLDAQAAQIVLNELVVSNSANDGPIELDSVRRASYRAALFEVYRLENSPERDTVIDILDVEMFPYASTTIVDLYADPDFDWMVNIRTGNPSGLSALDSMMGRYGLEMTDYRSLAVLGLDVITLRSSTHFNMPALAEAFKVVIPSLTFSEPLTFGGDGDRVTIVPQMPSGWRVRYSIGSGDCPSGCIFRKNYDFDVEPVCTEFEVIETGGTSVRAVKNLPLTVHPVPFNDALNLPESISRYHYEVFDVAGRRVRASSVSQSGPINGLQLLKPGVYLLYVRDGKGEVHVARIVK